MGVDRRMVDPRAELSISHPAELLRLALLALAWRRLAAGVNVMPERQRRLE